MIEISEGPSSFDAHCINVDNTYIEILLTACIRAPTSIPVDVDLKDRYV